MSTKFVQCQPAYLKFAIDETTTTAVVTEFLDLSGNPVVQADIGTTGYGTLEPNTPREEAVAFTINSNTNGEAVLTLTRGLLGKYPYGTGGTAHKHQAGSKFILSNNPDLLNKFTAKDNDETITGTWTFNVAPVALSVTRASTSVLGNVKLDEAPALTLGTATITIANPAVVSFTNHGLIAGDSVQFTTTGSLPTGLVVETDYYVISAGLTANSFQLSETVGGSAVVTTGSQSGVHTLIKTTPIVSYIPEKSKDFLLGVTGMVIPYAGSSAPAGFLLCDGAEVSRTTYASLFAVIGTTYGAGDGSTTFNIPNLQGRVPVGFDSAQTEFDTMGEEGGAKTHTLTVAEMPAHSHDAIVYSGSGSNDKLSSGNITSGSKELTNAVSPSGSNAPHNNLQPYLVLNYIIKY